MFKNCKLIQSEMSWVIIRDVMGNEVIVSKEREVETSLELDALDLRANTGAESLDYEPNPSTSELNVLNSPEVKTKSLKRSSGKAKKKSGNMLADLVSPPSEPTNIIDRFMDFLDELIRKLVNGFVNYLERNHEKNFDFIMNFLFRKKRTVRKKDGSYEDEDIARASKED